MTNTHFDSPESRDDASLQALLREELAGAGPNVTARVLGASAARQRAARDRVTRANAMEAAPQELSSQGLSSRGLPSRALSSQGLSGTTRAHRLANAAVMVLATAAVLALALLRWRGEQGLATRPSVQDPVVAQRCVVEVASLADLRVKLGYVRSVELQMSRPHSSVSWRMSMQRIDGAKHVLAAQARDELVESLKTAEPSQSKVDSIRKMFYVDLILDERAKWVVPVYPGPLGMVFDFGVVGKFVLTTELAGLGAHYERLDARANEVWASARSSDALSKAPNTLEELHCFGLDAGDVIAALRRMPALRRLHLWRVRAGSLVVQHIARCQLLEELSLRTPEQGSQVESEAAAFAEDSLAALRALPKLRTIRLAHRRVDPAELARIPALRDLRLEHCKLCDPGISLVAALPLQRCAVLHSFAEGDDVGRAIAEFASVVHLELAFDQAAHALAAVRALPGLRQLRELQLDTQPHWSVATKKALASLPIAMPWAKVSLRVP